MSNCETECTKRCCKGCEYYRAAGKTENPIPLSPPWPHHPVNPGYPNGPLHPVASPWIVTCNNRTEVNPGSLRKFESFGELHTSMVSASKDRLKFIAEVDN